MTEKKSTKNNDTQLLYLISVVEHYYPKAR